MDSIGQAVSLFPYVDLWRIRGKPNLNNELSITISIILIVAIGSIAISKLIEVSRMTTIFATSQSEINMIAPMMKVTTSSSDQSMKQFMFAIHIDQSVSNEPKITRSEYSIYGSHVQRYFNSTNGVYETKQEVFLLQACTQNHLLNVPDIQRNYFSLNIGQWLCLPLNKNFEIGGNIISNYNYIQVGVFCQTSNCKNKTFNGVLVRVYVLNTFVNPNNGTQPFKSFIYKYESTLEPLSVSNKYFYFSKNTLMTDNSLLPFQSIQIQNSIDVADVVTNQMNTSQGCSVSFFINHSGTTMKYKRSYLKILDALSYLGGIFNALLGAFFFMNAFGKLSYQIEFASMLFNKQQLKKNRLWTVIKQMFYKGLAYIGKQPDWEYEKTIQKFKLTVNNLLDIIYLQRRLQFLEKAVEIMFDKHQLKGLHLAYSNSREDADKKYKDHQFKENLLDFFKKKQQGAKQFLTLQNLNRDLSNRKRLEINLYSSDKSKQSQSQRSQSQAPDSDLRLQTQHNLQMGSNIYKDKTPINVLAINQNITNSERNDDLKIKDKNQQMNEECSLNQENLKCILKLYHESKIHIEDRRSKRIFEKIDVQIRQKIEELAQNTQISL